VFLLRGNKADARQSLAVCLWRKTRRTDGLFYSNIILPSEKAVGIVRIHSLGVKMKVKGRILLCVRA